VSAAVDSMEDGFTTIATEQVEADVYATRGER
jgi:hypothetical protein